MTLGTIAVHPAASVVVPLADSVSCGFTSLSVHGLNFVGRK